MKTLWELGEELSTAGTPATLTWPHPWLQRTGDLQVRSLVLVMADTNVGKSSFGLYLCERWASAGLTAGFISCEDAADRLVSKTAGWSEGAQKRTLVSCLDEAPRRELVMQAYDDLSRAGCAVVYVDYLQIIAGTLPGHQQHEYYKDLALAFKQAAKRHGNVALLASQITPPPRKGGDYDSLKAFPTLDMVRGSKEVAHVADFVIALREGESRTVEGLVTKNKWGPKEGPIGAFNVEQKTGAFVSSEGPMDSSGGPGEGERVECVALGEWDAEPFDESEWDI